MARIRTMDEILSRATAREHFNMFVLTIFGSAALLLAAVGIYGLMAYSVAQRVQEIGIRLALGATPKNVRNMVITYGIRITVSGIIAGLIAALGLTRLLTSLLFGVQAHDLRVFIGIPVLLTIVALLAASIPAWRASRLDPTRALRYE